MQVHFIRASYLLLLLNIVVILWGAFVRASGSGDGCGPHWPLCHGALLPPTDEAATWIEFTHRITSGLSLLYAIALFLWARTLYTLRETTRKAARWVVIFTLIEALIGAVLVLLGLVNQNASVLRVFVGGAHLINTFLLLSACAICAVAATRSYYNLATRSPRLTEYFRHPMALGLLGLTITAAFGAMAAIGDFLYPSESLLQGLQADFSPSSPLFVRLRILHPIIAVLTAGFIIWRCLEILPHARGTATATLARLTLALVISQIVLGVVTLALHSPLALQLAHLVLADAIWIVCTLLVWEDLQHQAILNTKRY